VVIRREVSSCWKEMTGVMTVAGEVSIYMTQASGHWDDMCEVKGVYVAMTREIYVKVGGYLGR